jgi:hypothetical protein
MVVLHDLDAAVWSQDKAPEWVVDHVIANGGFPWPSVIPVLGPIWTGERKGNPLFMGVFQKLTHKGPKAVSALVLRGPNVLIRDLPRKAVEILFHAWMSYISLLKRLEEIVGRSLFCFPHWATPQIDAIIEAISRNWRIPWSSFSALPVEWGKFYPYYPHLYWRITPEGRMEADQTLEGSLFPKRDMLIPELLASGVSIATSTTLPYKDSVLQLIQKLEQQGLLDKGNVGRWLGVNIRWTKARLIAESLVQRYGKSVSSEEVEKWASFWETHPPAYVRLEDVEGKEVVLY